MTGYVALIHPPVDGSAYGVTFPDLPGCASGAETFQETAQNAREALSLHLAGMRADGDPLPAPRSLEELRADPDPELAEELDGAIPQ